MSHLKNLLISFRPHQWIKNLVIFAAPIFGFTFSTEIFIHTISAFCLFCILSSATYLFNDVMDREEDRLHPLKKNRPVASGKLSPVTSILVAFTGLMIALLVGYIIEPKLLYPISLYIFLQAIYNGGMKNIIILDITIISFGFIIRAWTGGIASGIELSSWLIITVGFLAFLLGVEKRKSELKFSRETGARKVLSIYTTEMLNQISVIITSVTILCYSLWTIEGADSQWMMLTIPVVVYGLMIFRKENSEKISEEYPEKVIVKSPTILLTVFVWIALTLTIGLIRF